MKNPARNEWKVWLGVGLAVVAIAAVAFGLALVAIQGVRP